MRVKAINDATPTPPQVGQTIAFYNAEDRKFVRKRILTATLFAADTYDLTFDDTNNASDPTYTPTINTEFCPWSESLDLLVEPLLVQLDTIGPGEQFEDADMFDDGYRLRRIPENPLEWPSSVRHVHLDDVDDLPQVHDVEWISPNIPREPGVGSPGAYSYMIRTYSILAFPS